MKTIRYSIAARATLSVLLLIAAVALALICMRINVLGRTPRDLKKEAARAKAPAAAAALPPSGILFTHNTIVDFSACGGEPFINSAPMTIAPNTPAGSPFISAPFGLSTTVSLLWKSIDGGRTFIPLGTPIVRDSVTSPGGGDTHQAFDGMGRFYFVDLSAACVTAAVSDDGGNTFPKVNPVACIGGTGDPGGAQDDRQWAGAFGDGRGYMTVRNLAVSVGQNFHLNRTRDAGQTWLASQPIGSVTQSGPLVGDRIKRNIGGTDYILMYQIYYSGGTLKVFRIKDPDTGGAVSVDDLTIGTPGGSVSNVFPIMAVGRTSELYVTWSDGTAIFMMTSTDFGSTWSNVKRVSPTTGPEGTGTIIMPWIIAGDPGRVDIVWYRSNLPGNPTSNDNRWDIYMAQSLNALTSTPTFTYTKVNEHNIHFGQICLGGTLCDATVPPGQNDRSFLEYPSITIDHRGAAMITWNDNTNQSAVTAATPQVTGAPYVMFGKQLCGPSLFADVGNVGESGNVTITSPADNASISSSSLTAQGTHTIPPATFDRDEAGDAKFPDHGPVIGSNVPALDIKQVDMTETATSLIVHMQVADATLTALASATGTGGGDGLLYLVQWDYDTDPGDPIDPVFWVAAEVRGGQAIGRTGTLSVVRSATSKKYITYTPDLLNSVQVTTAITNTAPGTITLTIPKSLVGNPPNGALLKSVTGYAMSERGPLAASPCPPPPASCENIFNPSSLPIQVDAAGAFTYVMGAGMQLDGLVELSLDDPNFSFPTGASSNPNGTWQSDFADLSPGMHILYARQVVRGGCATSPVTSVAFTVPGAPVPVSAVSRKEHGAAGIFDIDLLPPSPAIECRAGTPSGKDYQIVVTFPAPVTVGGATVSSSDNMATADVPIVAGSTVTVNLHNVSNAQRLTLTLTGVNDGTGTGDVPISAGILLGDVTANSVVSNTDVSNVKSQVSAPVTSSNFRHDLTANGAVSNTDVSTTKGQVGTTLP